MASRNIVISFLEIQRLQLAGSSSTAFAVNLILYIVLTESSKTDNNKVTEKPNNLTNNK